MPDGSQWIDIHSDSSRLNRAISNLRNSTWDSTFIGHKTLEDAGLDCVTVQTNTWKFLAEVGVDFATQTDSVLKADGYVEAEYFGLANTILNVNNTGDLDHKALVHEAQHHAGWGVGVTDPTELLRIENLMRDAEDCQMVVKKEEEDDDEPNEGGGEDPTEPVCEEKLVPVYYTVDERELRRSRACTASDDVDGTGGECRWVYEWVLVPKQKVKWETQTVCSS